MTQSATDSDYLDAALRRLRSGVSVSVMVDDFGPPIYQIKHHGRIIESVFPAAKATKIYLYWSTRYAN